jgi:adenosylcobinamide amidohydrolase
MRNIECADCFVSVMLTITEAKPDLSVLTQASELSATEADAITVLAEHGMVPPLRFAARS